MHDAAPTKRAKRQVSAAAAAPVAAAAATTITAEPALLQNIISFLPVDETSGAQPRVVVKAIAVLCRAIPGLSQRVGPGNEAFWRDMVLAHFDFATSGETFNVDDWGGDFYDHEDPVDDQGDDAEFADWHRHPRNGPMREWARNHAEARDPRDELDESNQQDAADESDARDSNDTYDTYPKQFLVDSMHYWASLQAFFKPAAYGFLEKIQQDRSRMASLWPEPEDAFSLFCDLLLLPQFRSTDAVEWETWSDGQQPVFPCLLGRFPATIAGRGFAMLRFCDFAPYFWRGMDEPVSKRWSGFGGALPVVECKWRAEREHKRAEREAAAQERMERERDGEGGSDEDKDDDEEEEEDDDDESADHSDCEERTDEERSIFPLAGNHAAHPLLHLRRFVYETFSDWRRVHISQCEMASPEFYIGSTKKSGRWMGFVGQSDYWA